jgi:hypothetical protein
MGIFSRPVFRPSRRQPLPTGRPVSQWHNWDRIIPSRFPEPDLNALAEQVLAEFQHLAGAGALDGAHGRVLDRLAHEAMAAEFEATLVQYDEGCRILKMLKGQAHESAAAACREAERLARAARDLENQADGVYARHVGLARTANPATGQLDWDAEATRFARRRLQMEADTAGLPPARLSFRGHDAPAQETAARASGPTPAADRGNVVDLVQPDRDDGQPTAKYA